MKNPNVRMFDDAAARFFAPIASRAKLPFQSLGDGVYEIQSREFTMRVRRGTGHRKDILITLLPTVERSADLGDLSKEIGLGVIAKFRGENLAEPSLATQEEYFRYSENLAIASERLLVPYLQGNKTDFSEIKAFVAKNAEKAVSEIPEYRFPKNVRKEWI